LAIIDSSEGVVPRGKDVDRHCTMSLSGNLHNVADVS